MINRTHLLTGLAVALSGAGLGILIPSSALAQSSYPSTNTLPSTNTVPSIEMSPEGMVILCERSPWNSRCSGSSTGASAYPGTLSPRPASPGSTEYQNRPGGMMSPTNPSPSEGDIPASRQDGNLSPSPTSPQPGSMTNPGDSTAPTGEFPPAPLPPPSN